MCRNVISFEKNVYLTVECPSVFERCRGSLSRMLYVEGQIQGKNTQKKLPSVDVELR